ncbi:MAG: metal-dependent hydrolase [Anaerolineae bacterium]|jgi:membrane-bound metal-dependent hydrolase YbcI (DUF457 family)
MKGIAHFVTGVALATFFPEVVQQAAGGSLLPVLGGVAGILPDTLDFKFVRYWERYDLEIDPGPEPAPHEIAEQVAEAMRRAYETGEAQKVMLHTVRLGADLWRQYGIRFDPERSEVAVRVGPIVNTGQIPLPGSEPASASRPPVRSPAASPPSIPPFGGEVRFEVGVPMVDTYQDEVKIDIFSGPSFKFERRGDRLTIHFLEWHRRRSHSLTLAGALGLGAGGIAALLELLTQGDITRTSLYVGLVVAFGFVGHILEDQLGFMGSNLWYPLTRDRTSGLRLLRSGDAIPNFLTVWTALMLILFNLDRFSAQPRLDPRWFLGLAVVLPLVALGGLYERQRRGWPGTKEALGQHDMLSEAEGVDGA